MKEFNIDYMAGIFEFLSDDEGYVTVESKLLYSVEKILFQFKWIKIEFIAIKSNDYYFFYQDERTYNELLREFYDNRVEFKDVLVRKYDDNGTEKELLISLISRLEKMYNIEIYIWLDKVLSFSNNPNSFDLDEMYQHKKTHSPIYCNEDTLFEKLINLLPDNLEKQRAVIRKEKAHMEQIEKERREIECRRLAEEILNVVKKYYNPKDNFTALKSKLNMKNGNNFDVCFQEIKEIDKLIEQMEELCGKYILEETCTYLKGWLAQSREFLSDIMINDETKQREKEYGTIDSLKKKLRVSINRLGFEELLDIYRDYKYFYNSLVEKQENADEFAAASYNQYLKVYNYGAILISNKMNQLNRNKAKTRHIAAEVLDAAMCFYYETENISEAYELQKKERYSQDKKGGDAGERKVEYTLQWLDKSFISIKARSKNYIGKPCIKLSNPELIDRVQEYDHIIVGKKGVFAIETKNFAGKIIIDKYGNWIRKKRNEEVGMTNPLQQMRQHEKILKSFLPSNINIISILCIANDKVIIEGSENFTLPIVKSDMIVEFMEKYNAGGNLTQKEIDKCCKLIYEHMVN